MRSLLFLYLSITVILVLGNAALWIMVGDIVEGSKVLETNLRVITLIRFVLWIAIVMSSVFSLIMLIKVFKIKRLYLRGEKKW